MRHQRLQFRVVQTTGMVVCWLRRNGSLQQQGVGRSFRCLASLEEGGTVRTWCSVAFFEIIFR